MAPTAEYQLRSLESLRYISSLEFVEGTTELLPAFLFDMSHKHEGDDNVAPSHKHTISGEDRAEAAVNALKFIKSYQAR